MARTNNLTNFLTDVAGAIKEKKGSETDIPAANFDTEIRNLPSQGTYEEKTISITQNGTQTVTPSQGYDAIDELTINASVQPSLQSKSYSFTQNTTTTIIPEQGYDGFSSIGLEINVPTSGTDTSDATAVANDIIAPKTAYISTGKVTGTLPIVNEYAPQDASTPSVYIKEQYDLSGYTSLVGSNTWAMTYSYDTGNIYLIKTSSTSYNHLMVEVDGNTNITWTSTLNQAPNGLYRNMDSVRVYTYDKSTQQFSSSYTEYGYQTWKSGNQTYVIACKEQLNRPTGASTSEVYMSAKAYTGPFSPDSEYNTSGIKFEYQVPNKTALNTNSTITLFCDDATLAPVAGVTASKIAKGETILGIDGAYTSDATAVATDIKSGQTAYVNGTKITGTLPEVLNPASISSTEINNGRFFKPDDGVGTGNLYGNYLVTDDQGSHIGTQYLVNWVKVTDLQTWYIQNQQKVKVGMPVSDIATTVGLTSNILRSGYTVLGVVGAYSPSGSKYLLPNGTKFRYSTFTSPGDIDASDITDMSYMFGNCTNLVSVPQLDASNVTNMSNMFYGCTRLTTVLLSNTGNVTNMSGMFYNCKVLITVPQLDTSKVTNMGSMFSSCNSLSNDSLNTILAMCIGATSYTGTKTLSQLGLRSTYYPASTIQGLSNYSAFIAAGWTTGY